MDTTPDTYHKRAAFTKDLQKLANTFQALAHPARLMILLVLADRQSCICGEIVEVLPLSQASVSRHLKELKEAGLVQGEVEGPRSCYCLSQAGLAAAKLGAEDLFHVLDASLGLVREDDSCIDSNICC